MAVEKSVDARLLLASAALIAMHPDYAVAQEAQSGVQAPQDNGQLGDIVVTAQKRTERADKVPISISALSGQPLRDRHVDSPTDLVSSIPNLQVSSNNGTSTTIFSPRGVSMADHSLNQDGPVATYYDGAYKGNPAELSLAEGEKVAAYEVGFTSRLAGDHIRLSGAAFYYDYQSQQFIGHDASSGVQTLINLPKSRIYGGELEAQARSVPSPTLGASMGLPYSRVLRGSVTGGDVVGYQLTNTPHLTLVGNADWVAAQDDWGSIKAHGGIYWLSGQYFEIFNEAALHQASYAVVKGRIAYRNPSENIEFSIWMNNITNTPYYTARVDIS